ncbi:MAG: tRNA (N(6)-L-threonylcarbamoyladenosine(37)-C(2))-methylthiotransferase MtaB, partial [Planctomycetales bacterium]|nr:tRNA (N(6)-L-threonylcarbamoyladenosine(37)-C(2))-methylthiotransferase MtaB [Planctomycetales bacterium]
FNETLDACRAAEFSKIHIFPFSARRGTPAAEMAGQLPNAVKRERRQELARLEEELRDAYFASLRGTILEVLIEESDDTRAIGTSCRYAPVRIEGPAAVGEFVSLKAEHAVDGVVQGRRTTCGAVPTLR